MLNKLKFSFNQLKNSTKMFIGTSIPLVLIVILSVISYNTVQQLEDNSKMLTHTYQVIGNAANIEKLIVDMETGERGFLITGQDSFLEPFNEGKRALASKLAETKTLVSDNPAQVKRLNEMQQLIKQWLDKAAMIEIAARKSIKVGAKDALYLQNVLTQGTGKNILDKLRAVLDKLDIAFSKANHQQAKTLVVSVAKDMVDQETGQRGFLITGRDVFLEPYNKGRQAAVIHIEALNNIVDQAYNREDMKRDISRALALAAKWNKEIATPQIQLAKKVAAGKAQQSDIKQLLFKMKGKTLFDQIRKILSRMNTAFVKASNKHGENLVLAVTKSLVDQETGLRGFLLTGKKHFLEPYEDGKRALQKNSRALNKLVSNTYNIRKVRRLISEIAFLSKEWETKAAIPEINARLEMNKTKATMGTVIKLIESGTGKNIIDTLRKKVSAFTSVEDTLIQQRSKALSRTTTLFNWLIILGTVLIIAISLVVSYIISQLVEKQLNNTAKIAEAVASGDYSVDIEFENEKDTLGQALKKMTSALIENDKKLTDEKDKLQDQGWIKTNQTNLIEQLQAIRDLPRLAEIVMNELVPKLEAHLGLFYFKEQEDDSAVLSLLGSYAYKKRKNISNKFALGEGLVGQCALEKKVIILTEAPEHYIEITSGSGKADPRNIIVVPVLVENETLAVIEIASMQTFSEKQKTMLEVVANNLGVIMTNILSQKQTETLLKKSQQMSDELKEKTEVLKKSEDELKTQREELQVTNEELEEKTERLEEQNKNIERQNREVQKGRKEIELRARDLALASKYKSEFLANMSHELRTPLNSLLILAKNFEKNKQGNLTEKQIESASVIYRGGQDLMRLINDILDLSKVEAGKLHVEVGAVDLKMFSEEIKKQFNPLMQEKGLDYHIVISSNLPAVIHTDEHRLSQIIKNLFSNAIKFTSEGSITLKIEKSGDNCINFAVIDTGVGIPKDKQKEVFEAFQQVDGSISRKYGGTGLGLAISKAMAELLGGKLMLTSEPGKGSRFTLSTPTYLLAQAEELNPPQHSPTDVSTIDKTTEITDDKIREFIPDDRDKLSKGSNSILIIEDDKIFAKILLEISKEKGYFCLSAGDGQSAIALAKKYQPCAIILDLGLPDMDGIEVLEQLKQGEETRKIPVQIISGREQTIDLEEAGAIGYLAKPASEESIDLVFSKFKSMNNREISNVLIVENDESSQKAIKQLLTDKAINFDSAYTGQEAKDKIKQHHFDCVILDLTLPDISGFEVLKQLSEEKVKLPPVIVYTGRELSEKEYNKLQRYAKSIVLKGVETPKRLLDEVALFLHSVTTNSTHQENPKVKTNDYSDDVLENRKILLVDDDMRNVFALSSVLEEHGLDVVIASNGQAALDKLRQDNDIELVIMDIMMPIMDGYEAIKQMRQDEKLKKIPVIALTAKAMMGDRDKCLQAGASDYITKPVDVDQLLSMMQVWLYK